MKKVFLTVIGCVVIAVAVLVPLAIMFQDLSPLLIKLGAGSLILGIIILPFFVVGLVNVFRGIGLVLEKINEKYGNKLKGWKLYVYLLIHVGGYIALFWAIIRCL